MDNRVFDKIEKFVVDIVTRLIIVCAPMFTAHSVYLATLEIGRPAWIALTSAIAVEGIGFASVNVALDLWSWNRSKRKSDPSAPVAVALGLVAFYFAIAIFVTATLEIIPTARPFMTFAFPALSLAAALILALCIDQARRIREIANERAERSAARRPGGQGGTSDRSGQRSVTGQDSGHVYGQEGSDVRSVNGQEIGQDVRSDRPALTGQDGNLTGLNAIRKVDRETAVEAMLAFLAEHPDASYRDAGESVGRSKSWAVAAINELAGSGRISKNGHGWEVR